MPKHNEYRKSGGIREALDRFVRSLENKAQRSVEKTTVEYARHVRETDLRDLARALNTASSSAVRVNLNASPATYRFMAGKDGFTDDVVL